MTKKADGGGDVKYSDELDPYGAAQVGDLTDAEFLALTKVVKAESAKRLARCAELTAELSDAKPKRTRGPRKQKAQTETTPESGAE